MVRKGKDGIIKGAAQIAIGGFLAKLIGALLPLLAKKCKLDPAVVASPFITTIVDVLSLTICCALA